MFADTLRLVWLQCVDPHAQRADTVLVLAMDVVIVLMGIAAVTQTRNFYKSDRKQMQVSQMSHEMHDLNFLIKKLRLYDFIFNSNLKYKHSNNVFTKLIIIFFLSIEIKEFSDYEWRRHIIFYVYFLFSVFPFSWLYSYVLNKYMRNTSLRYIFYII